jgi:hypothetical protein
VTGNAAGLPIPEGGELGFRFALTQVARSLDLIYKTSERLCCSHPELAAHVRELGDRCAAAARESFRGWPA